jgi:hypothetical protein
MYEVSEKLLNEVLNYLGTRPFLEVNGLIANLLQSKKVEPLTSGQTEPKKVEDETKEVQKLPKDIPTK